jgi:type IV pilus assembly protein PilB
VVLRLLDKTNLIQGLDQLGMPPVVLERFTEMLGRPHGVLLVTGPTGSGKTTTLYSALHRLNTSDRCIVTVEDPVEYELPLITQVSLNPKAGLTFGTGLRAILRQDPDIILVGEIRDAETAAITMRAAMTGHLVLSTLHTNDPASAIPRLKELGISNLELASALLGVHAQRLVRLNCTACARPERPDPRLLTLVQGQGLWKKGAGCAACGFTGVKGRQAIHDLLPVTPAVRELIALGASTAAIEAQARAQGKSSLHEHALALARRGVIALEEAVRVTAGDD